MPGRHSGAAQPGLAPEGRVRLIVFAKWPEPGKVKTRLVPVLGEQGAAQLAQRLLLHSLQQAAAAGCAQIELCLAPDDACARARRWLDEQAALPAPVEVQAQGEGDLGERMGRACQRALAEAFKPLLIGTDCPECGAADLQAMAAALASHDAVIAPAADGGYPAIGLSVWNSRVFEQVAWSTPWVFAQTEARMAELGWAVGRHRLLHDIDEPADLVWLPDGWPERDKA